MHFMFIVTHELTSKVTCLPLDAKFRESVEDACEGVVVVLIHVVSWWLLPFHFCDIKKEEEQGRVRGCTVFTAYAAQ